MISPWTLDNNGGAEICPITTIIETSDSEIAVPTIPANVELKRAKNALLVEMRLR